jgi:hypothetical protein
MFPAIAALCMVCFLPTWFWERPFLRRLSAPAAGDAPPLRTPLVVNVVAGIALAYVLAWNVTTVTDLELPEPLRKAGPAVGLSQVWDMFAPSPIKDDGWYVIPGTLRDGREVDVAGVLRDDHAIRPVSWRRPANIRATYDGERWRKYLEELRHKHPDQHRLLAQWVCREWNGRHQGGEALAQLRISYVLDPPLPGGGSADPELRVLWIDNCA